MRITRTARLAVAVIAKDRAIVGPALAMTLSVLVLHSTRPQPVSSAYATTVLPTLVAGCAVAGSVVFVSSELHWDSVVAVVGIARAHTATWVAAVVSQVPLIGIALVSPVVLGVFERPPAPSEVAGAVLAHVAATGVAASVTLACGPGLVGSRGLRVVAVSGCVVAIIVREQVPGAVGAVLAVAVPPLFDILAPVHSSAPLGHTHSSAVLWTFTWTLTVAAATLPLSRRRP